MSLSTGVQLHISLQIVVPGGIYLTSVFLVENPFVPVNPGVEHVPALLSDHGQAGPAFVLHVCLYHPI
jgi:hypothetical protein